VPSRLLPAPEASGSDLVEDKTSEDR